MKLLFDENLSDRIVAQILDLYPGSMHVKSQGLIQTSDTLIWSFAKQDGYIIVSKDADFHQRSLVLGHPPKFDLPAHRQLSYGPDHPPAPRPPR